MARKPPTPIYEAWDDLVFRVVPWTLEERIRKWEPLYEQTWKDGQPVGDLDDAKLIITAGWGLFGEKGGWGPLHEKDDWEEALRLAKIGRTLIGRTSHPDVDDDSLIWHEAVAHVALGHEMELVQNIHELLDRYRPYNTTPLGSIEGLITEWVNHHPAETEVSPELREAALRFLEIKKRKRDAKACLEAKDYGDLRRIPCFMPWEARGKQAKE